MADPLSKRLVGIWYLYSRSRTGVLGSISALWFRTREGGKVSHVPLPMLRVMAVLMRSVNPTLARRIQAGVVMNTHDVSFDPSDTDHPIRRSRLLAWQR
jgi:hypothetical protein